MINGFFKDCSSGKASLTLDPKEPLYIIEIGAGHGKFSFHLLEALTEMKEVRRWEKDGGLDDKERVGQCFPPRLHALVDSKSALP